MAVEEDLWTRNVAGRTSYYKPLRTGAPWRRLGTRAESASQTAYGGFQEPPRSSSAPASVRVPDPVREEARRRGREIHAEFVSQTSCEGVLRISADRVAELHNGHVVTALHRAARFCRDAGVADATSDERWLGLVQGAGRAAPEMPVMSIALSVWSLATMMCCDLPVLEALSASFMTRCHQCTPHDLSGTAWAFAVLVVCDASLFSVLSVASAERAHSFLPQDLSLIVWSHSRLVIREEPLFASVALAAPRCHHEFAGQNLANTMWSFANVAHVDEPLFKLLVPQCLEGISTLGPLEVSTVVWSCASVCHLTGGLFTDAVRRVKQLAKLFEPQQLCSIVWSYARTANRNADLFDCIRDEVVGRQVPLQPTELNRLVWSFAFPGRPQEERTGRAGGIRDVPLLMHVASEAIRRMSDIDPLQSSSVAWSFASLLCHHPKLFDALGSRFADGNLLQSFDEQNIAYLSWAFARLRQAHPRLMSAVATEAARRGLHGFDHRHLSMLLWSFARLGEHHPGFWEVARANIPSIYAEHLDDAQSIAGLAMVINALHQIGERDTAIVLLNRVLALGVDLSGDAFGGWLAGCQAVQDGAREISIWEHMSRTAPNHGMRAAAGNMAAMRALDLGEDARAASLLTALDEDGLTNAVSLLLAERFDGQLREFEAQPLGWKPRLRSEGVRQARAAGRVLAKFDYYKEVGVLEYVLSRATAGDVASVCSAIEAFSREEHLYLKLGAEEKALALNAMLQSVADSHFDGPPLIVEIGCYVGFSSSRMAQLLPLGGKVVTMEVDPYHAAVSRSVLEMSGLSSKVEIWLGHSEHLIPRLLPQFGPGCVQGTFFDQKGTRYHEDLDLFETNGLLADGCFVSADNVVRPGAPEFMWRVSRTNGAYETQAIAHRDYGQDSVEDWISISRFSASAAATQQAAPCPESLLQLAYDSDKIRNRSVNERVTEEEWRVFAVRVAQEFYDAGIRPPVIKPQGGLSDLRVDLLPWGRSDQWHL